MNKNLFIYLYEVHILLKKIHIYNHISYPDIRCWVVASTTSYQGPSTTLMSMSTYHKIRCNITATESSDSGMDDDIDDNGDLTGIRGITKHTP